MSRACQQVYISAGASLVLLTLALVAVSTFDGSKAVSLSGAGAPGDLSDEEPAVITNQDVGLAKAQIVAHLSQKPTQIAAHIRGCVSSHSHALSFGIRAHKRFWTGCYLQSDHIATRAARSLAAFEGKERGW